MIEMILAIAGGISLAILFVLLALGAIFSKKIIAGYTAARAMYTTMQNMRRTNVYTRPGPLQKAE